MSIDALHDTAVADTALEGETIAQFVVLVFELADLMTEALVGVVDLVFVVGEEGELMVLFGDEAGCAGETPVALDGAVDLRLMMY